MKQHFGGEILVFTAENIPEDHGKYDMDASIKYHYNYIKQILELSIKKSGAVKFQISFRCTMVQESADDIITTEAYFNSEQVVVYDNVILGSKIWFSIEQLVENMLRYCVNGSGWVFQNVESIRVNVLTVLPVKKKLVGSYIPLPTNLIRKNGLINIRNEDDLCFAHCVFLHLHILLTGDKRGKHLRNPKTFKSLWNLINLKGIDFPISIEHISLFENNNPFSCNVFHVKDNNILPLRMTSNLKPLHLNLLLITEGNGGKQHFVYISNLSQLLGKMGSSAKSFCDLCLKGFPTQTSKQQHEANCGKSNIDSVRMPSDQERLVFRNFHALMKNPFCIYADFECLTKHKNSRDSVDGMNSGSYTKQYQRHIPYSFGVTVVDAYKKIIHKHIYRGRDAIHNFLIHLDNLYTVLDIKRRIDIPITFSATDKLDFETAKTCWLCEKDFESENLHILSRLNSDSSDLIKCAHHDHMTGKYIGACHSLCNLQLKYKYKAIPVVMHNFKSYDSHLILEGIRGSRNVTVIPSNSEHYISISIDNKFKFIDSYQFLPSSLAKLVDELPESGFNLSKQIFSDNMIRLVTRKGIFPYDYVSSFEKLETTFLPSKDNFYNRLTEEHITDEEYERAKEVWDAFNIRSLGEYSDLYLLTDVILLAEVFEAFRDLCINNHRLDPCHYVSSPGLSWDAMLRMNKTPISLLSDEGMYSFIEKGVRGGIAMVSKRYSEANNKFMKDFDPSKPSKFIIYYDFVNLYGWAMCMKLPYTGFRWLDDREIENLQRNLTEIDSEGEDFFALEVDLVYPQNLHDIQSHNDLPLAVDKRTIDYTMLSTFQKELLMDFPEIALGKVPKLVPSFLEKKNYVCHLKNLLFYLEKGLELKKVHRVLTAKQGSILEPYILFNSKRRQEAKYMYEISFWKNLNNQLFGKCLQNVRNLIDVKIVTNAAQARKLASSPLLYDVREVSENVFIFLMKRAEVTLDKPIFLGFSILELSKLLVYAFHYNYMGGKYNDKSQLLNIDTDGLIYEVETANIFEDMREHCNIFDLSDFPNHHPLFSTKNKKVPGKVKDEKCGKIIKSFASPKAKMLSLEVVNADESIENHKRAKGIKKYVINKSLSHEHYKNVVLSKLLTYAKMNTFRSKSHHLGSYEIRKIGLHSFDDKRYLFDTVNSLSYGHYKIPSVNSI
jgi:hypothetical protein